uniref:RING-type E3 ubiquitin transferase n=1 Tax=Cyanoderma ruficeps TaxID=181631 RepID=A0A8C3QVG5_9PASS
SGGGSSWSFFALCPLKWSCPICCDAPDDVAYVLPCGHRFCLGCILRWAERNPACPLCRRSIFIVKFSDRGGDDYLHCVITPPREVPETSSQTAEAPRGQAENAPHGPADSVASSPQGIRAPAQQQAAGSEAVGGILPELWAELFRRRRNLLEPVRPWLHQGLEVIYGGKWYQVKSAESGIMLALCVYGPDREVLVQRLQNVQFAEVAGENRIACPAKYPSFNTVQGTQRPRGIQRQDNHLHLQFCSFVPCLLMN